MNPFLLRSQDRLAAWRQFRKNLNGGLKDQCQQTAEFWAQAPLNKFCSDVYDPQSWPTPWQMIDQNDWCRLSVAIGMEFTLRLAGWTDLELLFFKQDFVMLVLRAANYYLNYEFNRCMDIKPPGHIIKKISFIDNGYKYN